MFSFLEIISIASHSSFARRMLVFLFSRSTTFLCNIAKPKYGLITNIGKTHCELLGSQENIAQAKCELLAHIPSDGVITLNSSDRALIAPWLDTCKGRIVWYDATGLDKNAEYRAENIIQHAHQLNQTSTSVLID